MPDMHLPADYKVVQYFSCLKPNPVVMVPDSKTVSVSFFNGRVCV
jgi:hypothetical protein